MDKFKAGQYVRYIDKSNSAFDHGAGCVNPSAFTKNAAYQIYSVQGDWITVAYHYGCSGGCFEPWTARRGDIVRVSSEDPARIVEKVVDGRVWLTDGAFYPPDIIRPVIGIEPATLAALKRIVPGDIVVLRDIPYDIKFLGIPHYGIPKSQVDALVGKRAKVLWSHGYGDVPCVGLTDSHPTPTAYHWPIECVSHIDVNEQVVKPGDTVFENGTGNRYEVQANPSQSEVIRFLTPGEIGRLASGAGLPAPQPEPKNTKFWMLKAENGGPPVYQHSTLAAAETEAERLAQKLGSRIHVLECISTCRPLAFVWERN